MNLIPIVIVINFAQLLSSLQQRFRGRWIYPKGLQCHAVKLHTLRMAHMDPDNA